MEFFALKGNVRTPGVHGLPPRDLSEILGRGTKQTMQTERFQTFVRKAAHDVRTPLTSIAGFAELLVEDASLSAGAHDSAAMILDEARRLSDLLEVFFTEAAKIADTSPNE